MNTLKNTFKSFFIKKIKRFKMEKINKTELGNIKLKKNKLIKIKILNLIFVNTNNGIERLPIAKAKWLGSWNGKILFVLAE